MLSRIKRLLTGEPVAHDHVHDHDHGDGHEHDHTHAPADEPAPRHERREAGRERHHETGEPAWEADDRIEDPPGAGKKNPDAAPEILGGD